MFIKHGPQGGILWGRVDVLQSCRFISYIWLPDGTLCIYVEKTPSFYLVERGCFYDSIFELSVSSESSSSDGMLSSYFSMRFFITPPLPSSNI